MNLAQLQAQLAAMLQQLNRNTQDIAQLINDVRTLGAMIEEMQGQQLEAEEGDDQA